MDEVSTLTTKKPKGLLDLPPEIWSKICTLAVTSEYAISIFVTCTSPQNDSPLINYRFYDGLGYLRGSPRKFLEPALTRVCRSIRQECLSDFYSNNMFVLHDNTHIQDMGGLKAWLDAIGPKHRKELQHLYSKITPVMAFTRPRSLVANDWICQFDSNLASTIDAGALFPFKECFQNRQFLRRIRLHIRTKRQGRDTGTGFEGHGDLDGEASRQHRPLRRRDAEVHRLVLFRGFDSDWPTPAEASSL